MATAIRNTAMWPPVFQLHFLFSQMREQRLASERRVSECDFLVQNHDLRFSKLIFMRRLLFIRCRGDVLLLLPKLSIAASNTFFPCAHLSQPLE